MAARGERVAAATLRCYEALPVFGKPYASTNGVQWTVLAGFVLAGSNDDSWTCIALGAGLKVLPHSKLPVHGDLLHDSHAEVVARRSLLVYLYAQIEAAQKGETSVVEMGDSGRWRLRSEFSLCMYTSTLPCGDASMYSLSLEAPVVATIESASPRPPRDYDLLATALGLSSTRDPISPSDASDPSLAPPSQVHRGRTSYNSLSALRTKPGRPDSPPTISHSCSDKMAMWNVLGVQGGLLSLLLERIAIDVLVIGDVRDHDEETVEKIKSEATRGIGGRLEGLLDLTGEYGLRLPKVHLTSLRFVHSKTVIAETSGRKPISATGSYAWTLDVGPESITNGLRQGGSPKRAEGEAILDKGRSQRSKLSLFKRFLLLQDDTATATTYYETKHPVSSVESLSYQAAKQRVRDGPFKGWIVSGRPFENFDQHGRIASEDSQGRRELSSALSNALSSRQSSPGYKTCLPAEPESRDDFR